MTWFGKKAEEIEELETFVESMKRGQTLATSDSLLETLRQIHDRRESPVVGHDHKQLLKERLRRQMAERNGQPVDETVPVPVFVAPAPRRRVLEWAVAASLAVHVGLGIAILPNVGFDARLIAQQFAEETQTVRWVNLDPLVVDPRIPVPQRRGVPRSDAPKTDAAASRAIAGNDSRDLLGSGDVQASRAPSLPSSPIAPPVAPIARPVVHDYSPSVERLAANNLPDPGGLLPSGSPEMPRKIRPSTDVDVAGYTYERDTAIEVGPTVPVKIHVTPSPVYSPKGLEYQITGKVRLSVLLSSDGAVRDVKVIRSLGYGLDEAAIEAATRIKFTPASRNGTPISVRTVIEVTFELR